jgi:hypothetical protein
MPAFVRAALAAALVLMLSVSSTLAAPDKPFKRDDLADAAIKLEAQIKSEAGPATRPAAALRREADAAFQRNDFRNGMKILQQIVAVAPDDSTSWLRLAKAVLQSRPANDREKVELAERAAAAGYIAYQRSTGNASEEAESLVVISRSYADRSVWRPALDALRVSLDLREVADVRQQYERMREDHGFRLLDYSVDSDSASPRVCFQFSEDLPGKRTDFSPFVAVAGQDKPAISAQDRQLCVEGLKHGERYSVTLRAGIPSVVRETLAKSADFNIYVRDRKPLVRFTGKAYVLPKTGQRGIPVVSVNTSTVSLEIYRIGDRNLIDTVLGRDCGRARWRSSSRSTPTSPPLSRSTRRSARSRPGSTSWWRSPPARQRTSTTRLPPSGSSSPIWASPRSPATTASTPSCIRSTRPSRKARSRSG